MLHRMACVVVTGATGGIGSAIVRLFREREDDVVAVARPSSALESLCAETGAVAAPMDLQSPASLPAELTSLERIDALVHAAGISEVVSVEETPHELWQQTLTANLTGPAELTRVMLPSLRTARGRVVFINAAPGLHGIPRWSAYAASKAGLTELADSLRAEEAPQGVRVTSIYPRGIATELLRKVRGDLGIPFDPALCVSPATLATVVCGLLDSPPDLDIYDISLGPPPP
jgi:NAD(P)-dependent dehydrogenase (short-subunit alcohol dehydrogenase family)